MEPHSCLNSAHQVTSITYPSGRVVNQNRDAIGRLSAVQDNGTSVNYASSIGYNAANQVTGFNYGNGVSASYAYSADRLQLSSLSYANGSTTLFSSSYGYTQNSGNNGEITSITDNVDSGRSATYAYDSLNRLTSASTSGSTNYPAWGLGMTYDRYGNRTGQSISSGCSGVTCPTNSVSVSSSTNQISTSGYSYDSSGNMTNDGWNTLVYDAENRNVSINSGANGYAYDGHGLRVHKCTPNCSSPTSHTVYIFAGSQVVAEYDNGASPSSPSREYFYSGGRKVAKIEFSATNYYHQDHLSNRLLTDSSGSVAGTQGHFPFGESWYTNNTTSKKKFTSYERDPESGNDYAKARYHVNRLGRFSSPDPRPHRRSPQGLNRYSYVANDPVNRVDPRGRDLIEISSFQGVEQGGCDQFDALEGSCMPGSCDGFAGCGGGGGGGDGGGSGGGACSDSSDSCDNTAPDVDQQVLALCISLWFGVDMTSFTPAQSGLLDPYGNSAPGVNGSFTGYMAGVFTGLGQPLAAGPSLITITSDASMTVGSLTVQYGLGSMLGSAMQPPGPGVPPLPPGASVGAYTNMYAPFTNYVGRDQSPADVLQGQIFELGNSLGAITGRNLPPSGTYNITPGSSNEPGNYLLNCYNSLAKPQ